VLSQAIDSSMPRAMTPQAVDTADFVASASVDADAAAQLCCPENWTHAWHSTRWAPSVDQSRNAASPTINTVAMIGPRFMAFDGPRKWLKKR
jgi:hypothetical protein